MSEKRRVLTLILLISAIIFTFFIIVSAQSSPTEWINQGWNLLGQNRYQEALQAFDLALGMEPNNVEALNGKATVKSQLGQVAEALPLYEKALLFRPDLAYLWAGKGHALLQLSRHLEALQSFNKSLSLDPNVVEVWQGKGIALSFLGRNSEAIDAYDKALSLDPFALASMINKGDSLRNLGRTEEATQLYTRVIVLAVKSSDLDEKGMALYRLQRYDEALQVFDQTLSQNPHFIWIWPEKGFTLVAMQRYDEALQMFDQALSLNPNLDYVWDNKGDTLVRLGRYEEAIQAYNQALLVNPSDTHARNEKERVSTMLATSPTSHQTTLTTTTGFVTEPQPTPVQTNPLFSYPYILHLIVISTEIVVVFLMAGVLSLIVVRDHDITAQVKALFLLMAISGTALVGYVFIPYLSTIPNRPIESLIFSEIAPFILIVGGLIIYSLLKNKAVLPLFQKKIRREAVQPLRDSVFATVTNDDPSRKKTSHPSPQQQEENKKRVVSNLVFISYSQQDKLVADAITVLLESQGIRCWIAPRDVIPGKNFPEAIIDAIDHSRIMVLVFSSYSNNSPHVIRELTRAVSKEIVIIPFRIEDIQPSLSMEYLINVPHWLDALTPPVEKHIDKLAEIVQFLLSQK